MSKPVIAAIDAVHKDVAPAALGAMLSRLLDEPLIVATAYPVDLAFGNLLPEYTEQLAHGPCDGRPAGRLGPGQVRVLTVGEPLGTLVAGNLAGREIQLAMKGVDETAPWRSRHSACSGRSSGGSRPRGRAASCPASVCTGQA